MDDVGKLDKAVDDLVDNHIESVIRGYESAFVALCHAVLRMTDRYFPGNVTMERRTIRRVLESIDETLSDATTDVGEVDRTGMWVVQELTLAKSAIYDNFEKLIAEPG